MRIFYSLTALGLLFCGQAGLAADIEGFEQVVPKGSMAPLVDPEFVPADQSSIADEAWVIGVSDGTHAKAYSVNLLNQASVVNDTLGDRPVLVVWDPLAYSVTVFDRTLNGKVQQFAASGAILHSSMVLYDGETESLWSVMTHESFAGSQKGNSLASLPIAEKTTWRDWLSKHPETGVLRVNNMTHVDTDPYRAYHNSPQPFRPVAKPDKRLPPKMPVFAFSEAGKEYCIAYAACTDGWKGKVAGREVFFYRAEKEPPQRSLRAYKLPSGAKLKKKKGEWQDSSMGRLDPESGTFEDGTAAERLAGVDTYWYVWSEFYPKTKVLNPPRRAHSQSEAPRGASEAELWEKN